MAKKNSTTGEIPGEQGALIIAGDQYFWRRRAASGKAVSLKCVSPAAVRAAFSHETIETDWLPPGIRRCGVGPRGDWLVMFIPPGKHELLFVNDFVDGEPAEMISLKIALPGLVFMGYARSYYMWAIQEKEFNPKATVYRAPFPNLSDDGKICFGANRYPQASGAGIAKAWQLFLDSPFNDHTVDGKSLRNKDDVRLQLLSVSRLRKRRYPVNDLVAHRMTVDGIVRSTLRR